MTEHEARAVCLQVVQAAKARGGDTEATLREIERRCEQDKRIREAFVVIGLASVEQG